MCAEGCWHIQGVREPLPARRHLPERRARRRSAVRGRSVAGLVTGRCVSCGQLLDTTYQQSAARDSPDAPTAELVAPAPSRARRAVTALPTPRICAPGAWRVTYHVLYWAPDASTAELGAPAGPVPSRPLGYDQVAGFDALVVFVLFWGYESRCPIPMNRYVPFLFIAAVRWPRTVLAADGAGLPRYP